MQVSRAGGVPGLKSRRWLLWSWCQTSSTPIIITNTLPSPSMGLKPVQMSGLAWMTSLKSCCRRVSLVLVMALVSPLLFATMVRGKEVKSLSFYPPFKTFNAKGDLLRECCSNP